MKLYKTCLFVFCVMMILLLLSFVFPQPSVSFLGLTLRWPSVVEVLESKEETKIDVDKQLDLVESTMRFEVIDSAQQMYLDSLSFYKNFFAESPTRIYCPNDSVEYLFPFFKSLNDTVQRFVHIIHYGDSQIEGDRISGFLRYRFQELFGGGGPGLLPLWQPIGATSVGQELSDSVSMYYAGGIMGDRAEHRSYGAMAQVGHLTSDTLTFTAWGRRAKRFSRVKLFAGNIDSLLLVSLGGNAFRGVRPSNHTECITWHLASARSKVSLEMCGESDIYGISLDCDTGVSLTNIPMRGSDGTFFTRMDREPIRRMLDELNTRLVIMEFGGNALPMLKDSSSVTRYCRQFARQIDYMHEILPQAQILVIGPADMAIKKNGELQTHPLLPLLVDKMREETTAHDAAYWDMYGVMGGYNSMIAWVGHQPQWAAPDYIHFTVKGADRIANVLWQTIMIYYDYMCFISKN